MTDMPLSGFEPTSVSRVASGPGPFEGLPTDSAAAQKVVLVEANKPDFSSSVDFPRKKTFEATPSLTLLTQTSTNKNISLIGPT